jgi:restriction endonuclease S subunit
LKTTLKHIASIQTGIFAKPVSRGEIVYLQSKYFNENGQLHSVLYPDLKADSITEKHLLRQGDILFAAKGAKNFATCYESLHTGPAGKNQPSVASTSFFVIRVQENFNHKVLPEFLVWLINHPVAQKFLKAKAIGTSIVSISKSVLEELEITIPDFQKQKTILKINQLYSKEKSLTQQIEALREKQIQQQIINSIKSEK